MKAIVTREQILAFADNAGTGNLTIRGYGNPVDSPGTGGNDLSGAVVPGDRGVDGCNVQIGLQTGGGTGYVLFAEGGPGGQFIRAIANVGFGSNSASYRVPKAYANSLAVQAVLQKSSGRPGQPGVIFQRGLANGAGPYYAAGWGGYGARPAWEYNNYISNEGDTNEYDVPVFTNSATTNRNQAGYSFNSDWGQVGIGGSGATSTVNNSSSFDRSGGNAGDGYVRIETYTNA
jgi:hypothetical protein